MENNHTTLLQPLNLPPYPFQLKERKDGKLLILDEVRKKLLLLTPEEWVRQHFIQWMVIHKKYPKSLIAIETGFNVNEKNKRSDIVFFDHFGNKKVLVECKSPSVTLSVDTMIQISNYNQIHKVDYLALSNGIQHLFFKINVTTNQYEATSELPDYQNL